MPYTYDHPHPAVTTDVVLFARDGRRWKVLLIQRAYEPYAGSWALPGGFLDAGEDLIDCAIRELLEETGIHAPMLQQLHTFGRADRDPRERVITVAYHGLLPGGPVEPRAGSDASAARWHDLKRLPPLAFDHRDIIRMAAARLGKNPPPAGQSKAGRNATRRQAKGPGSKVSPGRSKRRHLPRR